MKLLFSILSNHRVRLIVLIQIAGFLLFTLKGFSQYPGWVYYTAGNHVSCLAREGNTIWTGAWGGLIAVNRVTGVQTCYNHANSGLPDNSVYAISIDPAGIKWIGTAQRGLAKYDGANWSYFNTSNSGLPSNTVTSIAIDAAGTKWIGTSGGGGLAKFNGTSWVVYNTSNSGISSNFIRAVFIDAAGVKWISTDTGISRFDGTTWTVYKTSNSGIPSNDVNFIAEDQYGNKWVSLWYSGVAKFNGSTWTLYTLANTGVPLGATTTITIDQNDNKWIGTESSGLIRFDNISWTAFNRSNSGIISNEVRYTLIDETGNKWVAMGTVSLGSCIGGETGGLQKFTGSSWTLYNTSNSTFPDDIAESLAIEDNGKKWIGTQQGLAMKNGNVWTVYNTANSPVPQNYISQVKIDNSGNKWMGFTPNGVGKFDNSNWTFYTMANSGLPTDYITSLAAGANNVMWIATSMGLARFDGTNWVVYNTGNSGLPENFITSLAVDNDDHVWIAIDGYGITKFDGSTWTQYNMSNSGLPTNSVRKIICDHSNNLWIGTSSSGLVKFNGSSWVVYNTSNSGLPNNFINAALSVDCTGNLWLGSNTFYSGGLTKFDGTSWTTYSIVNSGMSATPLDIGIDESGNKWIATYAGLAEFHEGGINSTIISGVTSTNVTCNGTNNGTISISASGGAAPLQYSADNGVTWYPNGGLFTALPSNSYNVRVKDASSIVSTFCGNPVVITQPPVIGISNVAVANITCFNGTNGSIIVTATGGTGNLSYSIDNGATWSANNGTFPGLTAGTYTLKVKDMSNCEVGYLNNPIILTQPSEILISNVAATNITCNGLNDGIIEIFSNGGTGSLIYSIDNGATWQANGGFFAGLAAGPYNIQVKDAAGCVQIFVNNPVTIVEHPAIEIDHVQTTDVTYPGGNDGTITVTAHSGVAPLQYTADNGTTWQNSGLFSSLFAGSYFVFVKDADGCQVPYLQNPVVIQQPAVGIEGKSGGFSLKLYPNPFSDNITFAFNLSTCSDVTIDIFDIQGEKIATVFNTALPAGNHEIKFDGVSFKEGVYFFRLSSGDTIKTGKIVKI